MNTTVLPPETQPQHRLRLLEAAVEQSPVVIVITDHTGRIDYVNPKFCALTGYTKEEAVGKHTRVLNSGMQPREFYKHLWSTILSGKEWQGTFHNKKKNGELFWESASISPVRGDDGKISHFIAIKEDVTEKRAAEEELRRAREQAEAAVRAKDAFLANMSHELRTPLNAINGVTQTLLDSECPAGMRPALELIGQAGADLLAIIQEILCFSGLQAGKVSLEEKVFALGPVLIHSLRFAKEASRGKKLDIDYWVEPGTPAECVGDALRLQQILVNLVGNSVKFTGKGRVHLAVRSRVVSKTHVQLEFTLTDTGVGIPTNSLSKLFQPFTQADETITRRFGGTGLGLAICQSLAHLMGGSISVKSREGKGSAFRVQVLLGRAPETASFTNTDVSGLLSGTRILLSVPQAHRQDFLGRILEGAGATLLKPSTITYQADDPRVVRIEGTASCQLHLHVGRRSTTVDLPVTPAELVRSILACTATGVEKAAAVRAVFADTLPLRILVADDVRTNRETLRLVLHHLGYDDVHLVQNGAEALEEAEKAPFDLYILDLHMPIMDGISATRALREMEGPDGAHPRIVALTASTLEADKERCFLAGVDEFLTKPVMPAGLKACLTKLFKETSEKHPETLPVKPLVVAPGVPSILDEERLEAIEAATQPAGFAELWLQMTQTFLQDVDTFRGPIREACAKRDGDALYPLVHGVKGGALTIGWAHLGERCHETLDALRREDFTSWDTWPEEMEQLISESTRASEQRLSASKPLSP